MHNNINMSSVSANKPSADLQTDTVRWQQDVNEVFFFSQCDVAFWIKCWHEKSNIVHPTQSMLKDPQLHNATKSKNRSEIDICSKKDINILPCLTKYSSHSLECGSK